MAWNIGELNMGKKVTPEWKMAQEMWKECRRVEISLSARRQRSGKLGGAEGA